VNVGAHALLIAPPLDDQFGFGLYEGKPVVSPAILRTSTNECVLVGEDGHPYDVLQASLMTPGLLTKYNVPAEYHDTLTSIVKHRLSSNPIKVEAEINLTCFGVDGVDALKAALRIGQLLPPSCVLMHVC
jgi:translation initiation factor 2 alpha subunit (eIF-2alpha)